MLEEFKNSTGISTDLGGEEAVTKADSSDEDQPLASESVDLLEKYTRDAIEALRKDAKTMGGLKASGVTWKGVLSVLEGALPDVIDVSERNRMAYSMVPRAMNEIVGENKWKTEKRPKKSGPGLTTWIVPSGEKTLF